MGLEEDLANRMLCQCGDLEHSVSLGVAGERFSSNPHRSVLPDKGSSSLSFLYNR